MARLDNITPWIYLFLLCHIVCAQEPNLIQFKKDLMDKVRSRVEAGKGVANDQFEKVGLPSPQHSIGPGASPNLAPIFQRSNGQPSNSRGWAPDLPENYKPVIPPLERKPLPQPDSPAAKQDAIVVPMPARNNAPQVSGIPLAKLAEEDEVEEKAPVVHRDALSDRVKNMMAKEKSRQDDDDDNVEQKDEKDKSAKQNVNQAGKPIRIADFPSCQPVVQSLCKQYVDINFAVLDCIQNRPKEVEVPSDCQHFIWQYKRNLTTDDRFDSAASEVCKKSLKKLTECQQLERGKGHLISCLITNKENITNDNNCRQFLNKMASIVFADFRLMSKFAESCNNDIQALGCGRLEEGESSTSQGMTIRCLSEKLSSLERDCKREILRVAELQSDDFHQDRQLYFACRDDRERFCANVPAGSGKVFRCLFKHKFERDMTSECQNMLTLRQQLIQEDYKVSRTFVDACRQDIKNNQCLEDAVASGSGGAVKMSMILMCLESAHKGSRRVSPECIAEMTDFRKGLMEDYKISPSLVSLCNKEVSQYCGGGLQREGKTLHCLMDLARPARKSGTVVQFSALISTGCLRELKALIVEADIGEDYRLDRALQDACQPVVEIACRDIIPGGARVLSCLMAHLDSNKMTDDCEERLMEVQYFVARDFRLDHRLYRLCRVDARKHCHAPKHWYNPKSTTPDQGPLIMICLYHHMKLYHGDREHELDRACAIEVKRVMRERAVNVDLEPRIEEPCIQDLARFCSDETEKGQEVECLQDNLDDLDKECRWAVGNFTEDADEDPQLDRILIKACTPMIKEFCEDTINKNTEPQDVMECLIRYVYNPRMDPKCAAGINHHMILTMKDFRFSWRFKEACKKDVMSYCKGMKAKADVVFCLSERIHNDTLLDEDHRISFNCRKQLRFEKLQMSSNIDLSPRLKHACESDIYKRCRNLKPGQSKVIECLKKNQRDLTNQCHKLIFKREKEESEDNSIDFALQSNCRDEIKEFCDDEDPKDVLECLKKHKGAVNFEPKCRKVVLRRMEIENEDYRLNRPLQKACKLDIPKFCSMVIKSQKNDEMLEGKVINCLKIKYRQNRLSDTCEDIISIIIKEAAMDFKQDPILANACIYEIKNLCTDPNAAENGEDERGQVEECLKLKFKQRLIQNQDCQKEVLRIVAEGKADIHVDPLLHKSCALDIKHYCFKVPPGEGRQMSCLLAALDDKTIKLTSDCYKMLTDRVEMWEYAAKVAPPESMHELMAQITTSPSKHYFVGIICVVVGIIFIGGLFCGRITKKLRSELKNK